jgi:hypothetical protein
MKNYFTGWRKFVVLSVSTAATICNLVEMVSHIFLFIYIHNHNNTIGSAVLEAKVIKQRNRVNAVSTGGQMLTWFVLSFKAGVSNTRPMGHMGPAKGLSAPRNSLLNRQNSKF